MTGKGSYKENPKEGIVITVSSDNRPSRSIPIPGQSFVEVEQPNDEQVGSLTLTKTGEQPVEVKGDSLLAKAKRLAGKIKDAVTGVFHDFVYEESGVEGQPLNCTQRIRFIPRTEQRMSRAIRSSVMKG